MLNIYSTGHRHSQTVCEAFAVGTRFPIVSPARLLPGDVFMYGCLRGLKPILDAAVREGRDFYYADNGYLKPGKWNGYFRITKNALMHDGVGQGDAKRFAALGVRFKPWRRKGRNILVCPPLNIYARLVYHESAADWVDATVTTLAAHSDRPIVIRAKAQWQQSKRTPPRTLQEELAEAWAMVTYNSTATVEALVEGVPVFCTHPCAAGVMGRSDLTRIEDPLYPEDRERWGAVLAQNQFTIDEMKSGAAWNYLKTTAGGMPPVTR